MIKQNETRAECHVLRGLGSRRIKRPRIHRINKICRADVRPFGGRVSDAWKNLAHGEQVEECIVNYLNRANVDADEVLSGCNRGNGIERPVADEASIHIGSRSPKNLKEAGSDTFAVRIKLFYPPQSAVATEDLIKQLLFVGPS